MFDSHFSSNWETSSFVDFSWDIELWEKSNDKLDPTHSLSQHPIHSRNQEIKAITTQNFRKLNSKGLSDDKSKEYEELYTPQLSYWMKEGTQNEFLRNNTRVDYKIKKKIKTRVHCYGSVDAWFIVNNLHHI